MACPSRAARPVVCGGEHTQWKSSWAHHLVFCNTIGRGLDYRDVGEGFRATVKRAGITSTDERLSLHSLRHGFASLLISQGLNVVFVSRQLGHANPNITLGTYANLYARADHAATARAALDASHAAMPNDGRPRSARATWNE